MMTPEKPHMMTTGPESGNKEAEAESKSPIVPGLSKSAQKRVLMKAKDKKAKEDKKKASDSKEVAKEPTIQAEPKPRYDFLKKIL